MLLRRVAAVGTPVVFGMIASTAAIGCASSHDLVDTLSGKSSFDAMRTGPVAYRSYDAIAIAGSAAIGHVAEVPMRRVFLGAGSLTLTPCTDRPTFQSVHLTFGSWQADALKALPPIDDRSCALVKFQIMGFDALGAPAGTLLDVKAM